MDIRGSTKAKHKSIEQYGTFELCSSRGDRRTRNRDSDTKFIVLYPTNCKTFIMSRSLGRSMRSDSHPQAMESFPVRQLITSFVIWILPPIIGAVFLSTSAQTSSIATILILVSLVASVPISAYILYRIDLSKNDGCISVWGFR